MDVLTKLEQDFGQAFKQKNELVVLVLRQLKSAITNAEIAKNREKLSEQDVIKLLRSEVKKRKDASLLYIQGNRQDLADKESQEIEIIKQYLPAELDSEVIRQKVVEIITKTQAAGPADIGKVMGLVMKEFAGSADGNVVSQLVKEELAKK
ncbi:MAG: GatB/YqeY domain-containing protein [Candidatus Buchananbacteria bacterium]